MFEQNTLPFGTALSGESTGSTNQRFTSYDRNTVASLDYAVNRSYSTAQGRFTTVDPIGMRATNQLNPQSMNLYAYVENNPVNFTDPTGLIRLGSRERDWSQADWEMFLRFLRDSIEFMHEPIHGADPGGGVPLPPETVEQAVKRCAAKMGVEIDLFIRSKKGKGGKVSFTNGNMERSQSSPPEYASVVGGLIENDVTTFSGNDLRNIKVDRPDQYKYAPLMGGTFDKIIQRTLENGRNVYISATPWKNYTANNLTNPMAILATQVHELGNSIHVILGKQLPLDPNRRATVHDGDPDAGAAFEDCVFGGRYDEKGVLHTK